MTRNGKKTEGGTPSDSNRSKLRHPLGTLAGVIAETTKVYREMRDDKLDHGKGRSLVWVLSQLRAMVETQALERLEQRLEELAPSIEAKARNGHTFANRSTHATH